ncbi:MAG TPA: SDR family oxidoreductase [Pelolinea sp.]|nr:SDR family oxidoreductase [Pelolinea sp.]
MSLENKVAVITGVNSGVGRAVARRFAERGARLVLVGRSAERLDVIGKELELPEGRWLPVEADLSQPDAAQKVLDASVKKFGRADILFNFVGGWLGGEPISETPAEKLETMLRQHVWSTFYLAKVFSAHMKSNGWGRMAVISSPSAANPPAKSAPYSTAKAALEALMATLAEEMKGAGVTANVVRVRIIDEDHQREKNPSAENASWTTPEEISAALEYLCSEEGGTVNGARIPLYGSP